MLLAILTLLLTGVALLPPCWKCGLNSTCRGTWGNEGRFAGHSSPVCHGRRDRRPAGGSHPHRLAPGLNRISGCGLLVLLALMLVSALGIFYLGDERLSRCSSIAQWCGSVRRAAVYLAYDQGRRLRLDASFAQASCRLPLYSAGALRRMDTSHASHRRHPLPETLQAWRSMRALIADPEKTGEVFKIIEALKGASLARAVARLQASPAAVTCCRASPTSCRC